MANFPAAEEEEGDDIVEGEPDGLEEITGLCVLWKGSCMLIKAAIA